MLGRVIDSSERLNAHHCRPGTPPWLWTFGEEDGHGLGSGKEEGTIEIILPTSILFKVFLSETCIANSKYFARCL